MRICGISILHLSGPPGQLPWILAKRGDTVDDINPCIILRTLNYGNYGIFLIMGNAGFASSTIPSASTCSFVLMVLVERAQRVLKRREQVGSIQTLNLNPKPIPFGGSKVFG